MGSFIKEAYSEEHKFCPGVLPRSPHLEAEQSWPACNCGALLSSQTVAAGATCTNLMCSQAG